MTPNAIEQLVEHFSALPGIGPRQATRFVYFLLKQEPTKIRAFGKAIGELQTSISLCEECFLPREGTCTICTDPKRTHATVCVVEKESDALRLEKAGIYNGRYFVLGGTVGALAQRSSAKERITMLKKLVESGNVEELILGLNPTREGVFTCSYVEKVLSQAEGSEQTRPSEARQTKKPRITRLGRGLTTGAELEYVDEETLRSAFEGRR